MQLKKYSVISMYSKINKLLVKDNNLQLTMFAAGLVVPLLNLHLIFDYLVLRLIFIFIFLLILLASGVCILPEYRKNILKKEMLKINFFVSLGLLVLLVAPVYYLFYYLPPTTSLIVGKTKLQTFTSSVYEQDAVAPTYIIYSKIKFENDRNINYEFWYPKILKEDGRQYEVTVLPGANLILEAKEVKVNNI